MAELLLAKGYEVWGIVRRSSSRGTERIDHFTEDSNDPDRRVELRHGDLADASSLQRVLGEANPDEVYNLAAQSHVKVSFEVPEYTSDVTGVGVVRLLEAIRELGMRDVRFYQAASSEMFGQATETPQSETTPFEPRSPYAVAKAFGFNITRSYRESYGMFAVNGILFNHESPRRGENFVTRKISRAAARIKLGLQERVLLGNLDAKRDWGFAGDYVEGMWRMLQADEADDYVLATGEAHTVREFCEACFGELGMPLRWEGSGAEERGVDGDGRALVGVDPRYFRPAEVDVLLGDASKARASLGWTPSVSFEELARMMVEHDLRLAGEEATAEPGRGAATAEEVSPIKIAGASRRNVSAEATPVDDNARRVS